MRRIQSDSSISKPSASKSTRCVSTPAMNITAPPIGHIRFEEENVEMFVASQSPVSQYLVCKQIYAPSLAQNDDTMKDFFACSLAPEEGKTESESSQSMTPYSNSLRRMERFFTLFNALRRRRNTIG